MRNVWKYIIISTLLMAILLTGCSQSNSNQSATEITSSATATTSPTTSSTTSSQGVMSSTSSTIAVDTKFSAKDLEIGYEESSAVNIVLKGSSASASGNGVTIKDNIITISSEGTYVLTGTLDDGQVVVDAGEKDKVQLVLDGANIHCSDNASIYIKNADKVFITLVAGTENTLTDGATYVQTDDNTVDGVIFSKADLTINGEGTLNVTGNYKHGIAVKDQLTITGGIYNIKAVKDDINGNDGIKIKSGTFTLSAQNGNGISSKNSEDTTKGYVYICGSEITITNCMEGIEGTAILIEDGTINLTSRDDGFNASNGAASAADTFSGGGKGNGSENDTNCYISISGGTVNVDASGDGIDSNGSLYISGGTISVSGPTENNNGGLDYNGTADITGGTIVVAGSTGMAQSFSDTSTQYSLLNNFTSVCEAGTEITLTDAEGKKIASFTPKKLYQSVVISTPELVSGKTYTLTCGDQTAEITLSSVVTSNGQSQMGGPGMGNPGGVGKQGGMRNPGGMGNPGSMDSQTTTQNN